MSKVMLVATLAKQVPYYDDMDYIGVDRGALVCLRQNIQMKCAIGDFDSIHENDLQCIKKQCKVIQLSTHKDQTDSEYAIQYAKTLGYDEIYLFGCLGGRIDHEIANLYLLMHRRESVVLMNEHNLLRVLYPGEYTIEKKYKYLSFFALENSCITLTNVLYPVLKQYLYPCDIYAVSNEICNQYAQVSLHDGCVLCIQSEDEKVM